MTNKWADMKSTVKTMPNRSSVQHNIINNLDNQNSAVIYVKALDKNVLNRKKGVTEFADESRLTALHTNHDYIKALKEDQGMFKRKNGLFTHTYDAAKRFGIDKPFKA